MKIQKLEFGFSLILLILINSNLHSQETKFDIVGVWNSVDISKNESKTIFTKDGFVSITINGEQIDGKNYIIRGGPNSGQKAELKYEIDYDSNPIKIDFVAIKDKKEKGRILGIAKLIEENKFLLIFSFNSIRPENIDKENIEQTLTLTKVE